MKFEPAVFVKSAAHKSGFIRDDRPCIVFSGKSNVGKSSVINCLLNRKNLARVGSAPGKTTNVNYFLVNDAVWFVDLPGYGYAKVSMSERDRWAKLMEDFFGEPERITMGVQILDGRHKPTELDCMMNVLFENCGCPRVVVANKWDKLKKSEMVPNLELIRSTLELPEDITLLPFSAEKKLGRQELMGILCPGGRMNGFAAVWNGLDWSVLLELALSVVPALICITLHELSHGIVACWLGDDTAKRMGRLTLNPVRHIDWWGLLMMVLFKFGWAKPVPVNMYRFKNPRRDMAITALAGPVSNILITVVFLVIYGVLYRPLYIEGSAIARAILEMILMTAYISISLAVFNMIPISPLDGSKVLYSVLSDRAYNKLMHYERYGMILIMLLVVSGGLSGVLSTASGWIFDRLFIVAEFAFELVN